MLIILQIRKGRLHPLTKPQFEKINSINPLSCVYLKDPVVWNADVYALGRDSSGDGKLFKYSLTSNEWSDFLAPSSIYSSGSVLTTYCSKLLLISGEDMTVWEFSINDMAFKLSSIKPIPSSQSLNFGNIVASSKDEYLIVMNWYRASYRVYFRQFIYNGRDWNFSRPMNHICYVISSHPKYSYKVVIIDSHAILAIESTYGAIERILKAPILLNECIHFHSTMHWEVLEMIPLEKFDAGRECYSISLQNQQLYFVDLKGMVFTSFIQPPILPMVWGNSGVNFQDAPHLVGLPDGTMLMIGTTGHQRASQLDIIKISQKG